MLGLSLSLWATAKRTIVSAEAAAFLARTSGLDAAHRTAYTNLINGLVTDGVWPLLDVLQIYATQDQTTANLNLKSTSYTAVPNGDPTWAADVGYTSANMKWVDTGFNPTGANQFAQNSAHLSMWSGTTGQSDYPALTHAVATSLRLLLRSTANTCGTRVNDTADAVNPASLDASGFLLGNRISSATKQLWRNGAQLGSDIARASVAIANENIVTGGFSAGNQYAGIFRAVSAGATLTGAQSLAFYNRLAAYMTAIGASP